MADTQTQQLRMNKAQSAALGELAADLGDQFENIVVTSHRAFSSPSYLHVEVFKKDSFGRPERVYLIDNAGGQHKMPTEHKD